MQDTGKPQNEFRQPCPNCGNEDGGWRQPRFGFRCPDCWDIKQCPDGHEHVFVADSISRWNDGALYTVESCGRCGVGGISPAPDELAAAVENAGHGS